MLEGTRCGSKTNSSTSFSTAVMTTDLDDGGAEGACGLMVVEGGERGGPWVEYYTGVDFRVNSVLAIRGNLGSK